MNESRIFIFMFDEYKLRMESIVLGNNKSPNADFETENMNSDASSSCRKAE